MREEWIDDIIDMEWKMFQGVNNEGGRASCQDDRETFCIMRSSQFRVWTDELLKTYRKTLLRAQMQERNLITEKYARMMASTSPQRYQAIEKYLPVVSKEDHLLVEAIIDIHKGWMLEHAQRYPKLSARGRVLFTKDDTEWDTSAETYLRGELLTWPGEMLQLYLDFMKQCVKNQKNLVIEQDLEMVQQYGYASLEDAEDYA